MIHQTDSFGPPGSRVLAIRREPTPLGVDPYLGRILRVDDLGPNIATQVGRHVAAAKWAGGTQAGAPAKLPTGNSYAEANGWYLKYMSVGSNDDSGGTAVAADNDQLNNELSGSLKELTQAAKGDELNNVFAALGDTHLSYYTQIAWSCLYTAGEANGEIRELGLWIAQGTSNPSGDTTPTTPGGLAARGPLVSRKVLSGVIEKTSDFALEFRWVYIY